MQLSSRSSGLDFAMVLVTWYDAHRRDWPWRRLFKQLGDPFHVWVSEIMLQQTTIQAVLPAYDRFFQAFTDIFRFAEAAEEQVREACRGLGYYRRFRMLHQAAQELVARNMGQASFVWPQDFAAWKKLPGVGDYTAAAVSSIAFNIPKAVVDGNVERVFCRIFDFRVSPDPQLKKLFQSIGDAIVPRQDPGEFNQGLMELGQAICTKQSPKCGVCPVQNFCLAYERSSQHLAPAAKKAMTFEFVELNLLIISKAGKLGLVPRDVDAKFLKNTLGLPTALALSDTWRWETAAFQILPETTEQALGRFKHGITKHRLEAQVFHMTWNQLSARVKASAKSKKAGLEALERLKKLLQWVDADKVEAKLLANLDRKALAVYERSLRRKNLGFDAFFDESSPKS